MRHYLGRKFENREKEKGSKNFSNFLEISTISLFVRGEGKALFKNFFPETGVILNKSLFPTSVGQFACTCSFIFLKTLRSARKVVEGGSVQQKG